MERPPKLKKIFKEFYTENIGKRPGYGVHFQGSWLRATEYGAYDFLTFYCGKLNVSITGNENLDADMLNIFAQTFVKHFWNTRIGFKRSEDFFLQLSAFLNEQLPLWAQFFNEAIYKRGAFITNAGKVFVDSTGTLKFEENNTTQGDNTTNVKGGDNSTSHTSGSTQSTTTTSANNKSQSNDTRNTTNQQEQNNQALDLETTAPQNRINYNGDKVKGGDLTGAYDFTYADKVTGNFTHNQTTGTENVTGTNTTTEDNKGTSETNATDDTTTTSNGSNYSATTSNNNTTTTGQHTQDTTGTTATSTQERNADVFQLARGLNALANGAYLDIFTKAKRQGLFLLTYY